MGPLCKQYIYIFQYIYIIREWFVQRGPPPLQMFDGKHRSRIIAREQFLKREGGGFAAKRKRCILRGFLSRSERERKEEDVARSQRLLCPAIQPPPPGRDYHPWRAFNPLATFFSIHFPANVVYRLPSHRGKELCNLERISNR